MADGLLSQLGQRGIDARLGETFRSSAYQDRLYALGRTLPGSIVTNAQGGQTFHNFGVAFDIRIDDPRGSYIANGSNAAYTTAGQIGQSIGLEWGGAWTSPFDPSHFQYPGGQTLTQIQATFETGHDVLCKTN